MLWPLRCWPLAAGRSGSRVLVVWATLFLSCRMQIWSNATLLGRFKSRSWAIVFPNAGTAEATSFFGQMQRSAGCSRKPYGLILTAGREDCTNQRTLLLRKKLRVLM